jgi:tRNA(Ile)-lysidine synthase TilS/MesJ
MNNGLNYQQWKNQYGQFLETFSQKKVMMFFSGGKDSSVILGFIQQASREYGFSFETHAGMYPRHVFTLADRKEIDDYWNARGVLINWHVVPESDDQLDAALAEGVSPCLICNTAKKKKLMEYFKEQAIDMNAMVIIMSYSLWDLVSATIEHILGASYAAADASPAIRSKSIEERFLETSQRFYPLLKLNNGFSVFKPLIHFNDQDILEMISREKIPILSTACRFKEYRPKRLFAQYYTRMNLNFDFDKVLDFAKTSLRLPEKNFFTQMENDRYLKKVI